MKTIELNDEKAHIAARLNLLVGGTIVAVTEQLPEDRDNRVFGLVIRLTSGQAVGVWLQRYDDGAIVK